MTPLVEEILTLARQSNVDGVFAIESAARDAGVVQAPSLTVAAQSTGEPVSVTIHEDRYQLHPLAAHNSGRHDGHLGQR